MNDYFTVVNLWVDLLHNIYLRYCYILTNKITWCYDEQILYSTFTENYIDYIEILYNKISNSAVQYVCLFLLLQFDLDKFSEVFTDLKWFEGKKAERSEKEQMEGNSRKVCRILHVSVKLMKYFTQFYL